MDYTLNHENSQTIKKVFTLVPAAQLLGKLVGAKERNYFIVIIPGKSESWSKNSKFFPLNSNHKLVRPQQSFCWDFLSGKKNVIEKLCVQMS